MQVLRERLVGRQSETEEQVERRVNIAKQELEDVQKLDFFETKLVNDELDRLYEETKRWFQAKYPSLHFNFE